MTLSGRLAKGQADVHAVATDGAGNIATSDARTYTFDVPAPVVAIVTPAEGAATKDLEFSATAADAGNGAKSVSFVVTDADGATIQTPATVANGGSYNAELPGNVQDGKYVLQARAEDNDGDSRRTQTALPETARTPGAVQDDRLVERCADGCSRRGSTRQAQSGAADGPVVSLNGCVSNWLRFTAIKRKQHCSLDFGTVSKRVGASICNWFRLARGKCELR